MPVRGWAMVLLLGAACASAASAQPLPPEPPSDLIPPPAADAPSRPAARPPRVSLLGEPVESRRRDLPPEPEQRTGDAEQGRSGDRIEGTRSPVRPLTPSLPKDDENRGAVIGRPINDEGDIRPVSGTQIEGTVRRTSGEKPADVVDEFFRHRSTDRAKDEDDLDQPGSDRRRSHQFGDRIMDAADSVMGPQGDWFRSDHAYDCYSSPITNPFLFEDPRSLTEVRPIFIYQQVPSGQPDFQGGNIIFFGAQARLAITERWSVVMHKLGGISINPKSDLFESATGFAEIWLGPKYTFYRDDQNGALAAGGLQFQIPGGSSSVWQDTGSLSLVPYLSYAHPFFRDSSVGTLNTMFGTGYSFSTTAARSDYYYLSAHADLNVLNGNRFFPMMEFNWLINTTNGNTTPFGSEGRDLINFGSQASGVGQLTWAIGGRLKLTEAAQMGFAYEMPIAGPKEFFQYRFTVDFILRY